MSGEAKGSIQVPERTLGTVTQRGRSPRRDCPLGPALSSHERAAWTTDGTVLFGAAPREAEWLGMLAWQTLRL